MQNLPGNYLELLNSMPVRRVYRVSNSPEPFMVTSNETRRVRQWTAARNDEFVDTLYVCDRARVCKFVLARVRTSAYMHMHEHVCPSA